MSADFYSPRPLRFIEQLESAEWSLKVYGIAANGAEIGAPTREAVDRLARAFLPRDPLANDHFGLGFVIAHEGGDSSWILLDWWTRGGILRQRVFRAPLGSAEFTEYVGEHALACVWELPVIAFERDAWVRTAMAGQDPASYLRERFESSSV